MILDGFRAWRVLVLVAGRDARKKAVDRGGEKAVRVHAEEDAVRRL